MSMKEEYTAIGMATAAADGFRAGQRAAQSAPAGEREAFELASVDDSFGSLRALGAEAERRDLENGDYIDFAARKAWEYFQAGAAWQRAQSAGVPDGYALVKHEAIEYLADQWPGAYQKFYAIAADSAPTPTVKAEQLQSADPCGLAPHAQAFNEAPAEALIPSLPAAGSAVEEVEVVAYLGDGGTLYPNKKSVDKYLPVGRTAEPLMTVAQHQRIVAALSAQQSAQPEFCCEHSYKVAKQAAWGACELTQCKCDHNEYCEHCWPDDFREGGKWHNGFEAQQSAPERVSVPRDLLADLISSDHDTKIQAERALYALLASHAGGWKV